MATEPGPRLLTVGHGSLDREQLGGLLRGAGVEHLVDVRRFPGSRRNPAVARDELPSWLPAYGVGYRWEERLGGRRRPAESSPDSWWRVEQFRGYAGWTRTDEFRAALARLLEEAAERTTAIMCSEAVWWRCHRRLVADVAVLVHGVEVLHLMPDGRLVPHPPAEGARVVDGDVVWDRAPQADTRSGATAEK